ncbi:hypothetical protein F5880DRAFT_193139 [Lentinula raphanica]|nr:hypothetical protein F5880DRAFT_193139 [Lentinula raphanica]
MPSAENKAADEKIKQENASASLDAEGIWAETDLFQCGRCKQKKTRYCQAQTRSPNEPMKICIIAHFTNLLLELSLQDYCQLHQVWQRVDVLLADTHCLLNPFGPSSRGSLTAICTNLISRGTWDIIIVRTHNVQNSSPSPLRMDKFICS